MQSSLRTITYPGTQHFLTYRPGPAGTVELVDINVFGNSKRKGIGTELVNSMLEKIGHNKTIYLFTRKSNKGAQKFYQALKFTCKGTLQNFYNENCTKEDALLYVRHV